jgi:hypothetical protein
MKKILIAGAVAVGATVASVGAASAAPGGGCPTGGGWGLASTAFIIESLDNGNYVDQNGDGRICLKLNEGQTQTNGEPSFTAKDNTN